MPGLRVIKFDHDITDDDVSISYSITMYKQIISRRATAGFLVPDRSMTYQFTTSPVVCFRQFTHHFDLQINSDLLTDGLFKQISRAKI